MMEFIPNPHKIEHPAGVHMLDNQSRITLWQTEPAALLYAQMLQGCLREYAGLEVPFTRGKPRAGDAVLTVDTALPQNRYTLSIMPECVPRTDHQPRKFPTRRAVLPGRPEMAL